MILQSLDLTTPSILFSAVSLILLAYTNRFLAYAQVVRNLKDEFEQTHAELANLQLANLTKRLYLARSMQIFGVTSLFLCVICTLFIFVGLQNVAIITFLLALIALTISLAISIREILISVKAVEYHLHAIKKPKPKKK